MKKLIYTLLISVAVAGPMRSVAQNEKKDNHRYLSLGIRLAGLQANDLTTRAFPTCRILLSVDPVPFFRIEGQFGLYRKSWNAGLNGTLKDKSTYLGFGALIIYPREQFKFLAGIRYGKTNYSEDRFEDEPVNAIVKDKGKITALSGVLGGEYFPVAFFSVGAEFCFTSLRDDFDPASSMAEESPTTKTLLTEGSLILRFYPF